MMETVKDADGEKNGPDTNVTKAASSFSSSQLNVTETNSNNAVSEAAIKTNEIKDEEFKIDDSTTAGGSTEMDLAENGNEKQSNQASQNILEFEAVVSTTERCEETAKEDVAVKVVYNKVKYDIVTNIDSTVEQFKSKLEVIINVPKAMQKVMFKGLAKDNKTLREIGITAGAKVMIVGSKLDDIVAVNKKETVEDDKATSTKELLCRQKIHRKVLDKGVPDDAMPGILGLKEPLPPRPLSGMLNKLGGKVRLTFKMEQDQIWIGTRERTEKLSMNTIKNVVTEPIEGFEHYHIMGLQLGSTEASRYWIYWVPAQYADAIKDAILGKWQYF